MIRRVPAAATVPPPPMLASSSRELPAGPAWSYEVKWDGYRALAQKRGASVGLFSRRLNDFTRQYPAIRDALAALPVPDVTLDGEIVALDEAGRPSFQALQHRGSRPHRIAYYVFDVLRRGGANLMRLTLDERRSALRQLALKPPLYVSEPLPGTPPQIAAAIRRVGLEGVIAKRRDSRYEPGMRSPAWVKVKFLRRQEFVAGGYKPSSTGFESLVVGYYDAAGKLWVAGKVRNGFTPAVRAELWRRMRPLQSTTYPFADVPTRARSHWGEGLTTDDLRALRWLKPRLVVEVAFVEWTADAHLRHAVFAGVRDDKTARSVRREP